MQVIIVVSYISHTPTIRFPSNMLLVDQEHQLKIDSLFMSVFHA